MNRLPLTVGDLRIAVDVIEEYYSLLEKDTGFKKVVGVVVRGALRVTHGLFKDLLDEYDAYNEDNDGIPVRAYYDAPEVLDSLLDSIEIMHEAGKLESREVDELTRSAEIFQWMCLQATDAYEGHIKKAKDQQTIDEKFQEIINNKDA